MPKNLAAGPRANQELGAELCDATGREKSLGPLAGVRVVEFTGIGPGPHCAMLLSDFGAEVLRIDRPGGNGWPNPVVDRGRHAVELDIRSEDGLAVAQDAIGQADVLIEGYRPGVMERLGLGPEAMMAINPRLIYGRMTGWGQSGPLAMAAGHDINYLAVTGALAAITDEKGHPVPPLGLVGDIGGGALYLAFGIVAALLSRDRTGKGQVVDAAIVDGVVSMMATFAGAGPDVLSLEPEKNRLGGRAPYYRCYECADGRYVAVGPIERHFYTFLLDAIGAPQDLCSRGENSATWRPDVEKIAAIFQTRSQKDWCGLLEATDACFAPVLSYEESKEHAHMQSRCGYSDLDGVSQPAPAPRLSGTPGRIAEGGNGADLLRQWLTSPRPLSDTRNRRG